MFGTLVLFSAGLGARPCDGSSSYRRQLRDCSCFARFLLMLGVALIVALLPLRLWAAVAYPAYVVGVIMLVMVPSFGGVIVNGAERWLQILPGFRLQPSEFMKIAVPLSRWRDIITSPSRLGATASGSTSWRS